MPPKASNKQAGRKRVRVVLPPLPADRFYAGVKKRPGPKRRPIADAPHAPPKPVESRYRSYTVSYKLRILSYWQTPSIPIGPTGKRIPRRDEVAKRYKISSSNLSRWQKEEKEGKFLLQVGTQKRAIGGGCARRWVHLERELYQQFLERRAMGKSVRRSWFRRTCKTLFPKIYPSLSSHEFSFSNGWFRGFLSWHQISLRIVTNKASQLPSDFTDAIVNWFRYNRRNSQLRPDDERGLGDEAAVVGRYRLRNIGNMDQTPIPFEYLEGRTCHESALRDRDGWR